MKSRNNLHKLFALLLVCVLCCGMFTGCGKSGATTSENIEPVGNNNPIVETIGSKVDNTEKTDETLIVIVEGEPDALCALNSSSSSFQIHSPTASRLVNYDAANKTVTPGIAENWEAIDETHYRFTIREGITFSNGTPITAEDVLFCLQCYEKAGSSNMVDIDLSQTTVENDRNIVIAFKKFVPGWEFTVADIDIYSKADAEAIGMDNTLRNPPAGAGKYVFKEWKSGEYVLYERNESYWDDTYAGYYKYIKVIWAADSASRVLAVQSGDANVANRISTTEAVMLKNDPSAHAVGYDCGVTYHMLFNCETGVCTDPKVREALSYAVDAEAVNNALNMGMGNVAQGWILPSFPYYKEYFEGGHLPYDPDLAKQKLADAGYPNGIELKLLVQPANKNAATVVQESMRAAGISVDVQVQEAATFVASARAGEFDLQIGNNALAVEGSSVFNHIDPAKIGKAVNNIRCNSDELSAAIARAQSFDLTERAAGYSDVIDFIFGNHCLVGLCDSDKYCAMTVGLNGLTVGTGMGYIDVTNIRPE